VRGLRHLLLDISVRDYVLSWDNLERCAVVNKEFLVAVVGAIKNLVAFQIHSVRRICSTFLGITGSAFGRYTRVFRRTADDLVGLLILITVFFASRWIVESMNRVLGLGLPQEQVVLLIELVALYFLQCIGLLKESV
jgi:hypothetical protein